VELEVNCLDASNPSPRQYPTPDRLAVVVPEVRDLGEPSQCLHQHHSRDRLAVALSVGPVEQEAYYPGAGSPTPDQCRTTDRLPQSVEVSLVVAVSAMYDPDIVPDSLPPRQQSLPVSISLQAFYLSFRG
jgi:hypothetical protein